MRLIQLVQEGNYEKLEKYSKKKIDLKTIIDAEGNTLLHHSCLGVQSRIVEYLLQKGCSVNSQNLKMESPLHLACRASSVGAIHHLLCANANPNYENEKGEMPLHYACQSGNADVVESLLRWLGFQMKINHQAKDGTTPLMWAATNQLSIVNQLLNVGADPSLCHKDGSTPLHWACYFGSLEIVKALLDAGAPMNAINHEGNTPLHISCIRGNPTIVRELISRGVELNCRNTVGKSPCDLAQDRKQQECLNLLLTQLITRPESRRLEGSEYGELRESRRLGSADSSVANEENFHEEVESILGVESYSEGNNFSHQVATDSSPDPLSKHYAEMNDQLMRSNEELRKKNEELTKATLIGTATMSEILVALDQGAADSGLPVENYIEMQVLRHAIGRRSRNIRLQQVILDINQESDPDTLRSLGFEFRALDMDSSNITIELKVDNINQRSASLIKKMNQRAKDMAVCYGDEEASVRCQLAMNEFQVRYNRWQQVEAHATDDLIRRLTVFRDGLHLTPISDNEIAALNSLMTLLPTVGGNEEYQQLLRNMKTKIF